MTEPLIPEEIEELRAILPAAGYTVIATPIDQWMRLCDIAEDHARLHAATSKLQGAMAADDARLRAAERRVWSDPDMTWGCDAAEHLADTILDLRAENAVLRERVGKLKRVRRAVIHCERYYGEDDVNWQIELNAALAACDEEDGND